MNRRRWNFFGLGLSPFQNWFARKIIASVIFYEGFHPKDFQGKKVFCIQHPHLGPASESAIGVTVIKILAMCDIQDFKRIDWSSESNEEFKEYLIGEKDTWLFCPCASNICLKHDHALVIDFWGWYSCVHWWIFWSFHSPSSSQWDQKARICQTHDKLIYRSIWLGTY